MPVVLILHNEKAGDQDTSKKQLLKLFDNYGFDAIYKPLKDKKWLAEDEEVDMIISAGGDGTVHKIVEKLLAKKLIDKKHPIAVLPFGTANNISATINGQLRLEDIIQGLKRFNIQAVDIGCISGVKDISFFLEGMGIGAFPLLISEMKKRGKEKETDGNKEIRTALEIFYDLILSYKPEYCKLVLDGIDHSGKYVMVEVMNIKSVGPQLLIAKDADPSDGFFDVVLVDADEQRKLSKYIEEKIDGKENGYYFKTIRAKKIELKSSSKRIHIDDNLIKLDKGKPIKMEIRERLVDFIIPGRKSEPG
jgi:diacylglycerol kinase (ATP)